MEVLLGISSNQIWDFTASYVWLQVYTSRTAQGGGGGFKNRKPTGEVSCCETWMAERTDGPKGGWGSESLHLSLSLYLCFLLSVSIYLCHMYLSICLSVYLPTCLPVYLSIYLSSYLSVYVSICLSDWTIYLSIYLPIYLSVCLSIYVSIYLFCLSIYLCIYLSFYLKGRKMQDFLHKWKVTAPNSSNSARLLQKMTAHSFKTKKFCETPQFLTLITPKTKQFCETYFKTEKLSAELTASYQCVLRFFRPIIILKYCACHEKVKPGHTKCCTCHSTCILTHPLQTSHACHRFWNCCKPKSNPHIWLTFEKVQNPYAPARPNRIRTSKSAPSKSEVHSRFWLRHVFRAKMASAFWTARLNCQKCSAPAVFRTFWPQAWTFSTSQLPKVFRDPGGLSIFDFKICFAPQRRATFNLSSPQMSPAYFSNLRSHKHWRSTTFRNFTFSRALLFFLLILFLLILSLLWRLSPLLLHLSISRKFDF